jgi:hypothetical protein
MNLDFGINPLYEGGREHFKPELVLKPILKVILINLVFCSAFFSHIYINFGRGIRKCG